MKTGSLPAGVAEDRNAPFNSTLSHKQECERCEGTGFVNYEDEPEVCAVCHGLGYIEIAGLKEKEYEPEDDYAGDL